MEELLMHVTFAKSISTTIPEASILGGPTSATGGSRRYLPLHASEKVSRLE
jgi:hypothetical protein